MKSRQVPFFLYWRVENVQFWINSIGHLGWLSCTSNFPRFHKNVNSLELWKYISENSSPKGSFWRNKKNPNFPNCRGIFHIYWQWLLKFFRSFGRNFRCKLLIKFLRRLKEAHLRFFDFKNLTILKCGYARKQLQIYQGQFNTCNLV